MQSENLLRSECGGGYDSDEGGGGGLRGGAGAHHYTAYAQHYNVLYRLHCGDQTKVDNLQGQY